MQIVLQFKQTRSLPKGRGGYCPDPWKWGGRLYRQRRHAEALAAKLGPAFVVAYGSYDEEQYLFLTGAAG